MGKIETWEVAGRTDESITFLYKRRTYNEEKLEKNSKKKPKNDDDGFDEETRAVLRKLDDLNMQIRKRYHFGSVEEKVEDKVEEKQKKKKISKTKAKKSEDLKSEMDENDSLEEKFDDSHVMVNGVLVKKGTGSEPVDHRGVPLSHPMAMTPYPGATTAAQREKARKMLKEIAKQMHEEEMKKKAKEEKSSSTKSSTKSELEKSKSNTSKSSNKKMGCDKCGSCQKCIHRCSQKHPAAQKVTLEERDEFLKSIKNLRQRIVKPERSREKATKSPYDVTQSESDSDLSKSKSVKGSKKKSQEK
ncbi:hypothetical protein CAEBREN_10418 [Caenorhabditis brenneri]|uniref:Uncharacterized protein n=1 Tax=Caenorhabditis brenneri TaxID=135651 RepID=G0MIL0_CAEBE|nr:hypothetical protein CAEBREN_10418 [Caenorhabditis brenneri]